MFQIARPQFALLAATALTIVLGGSAANAQIPKSAVDAAFYGPTRTMKLTACAAHTYGHRTRIEKMQIVRSGNALIAYGKLVNVIHGDSDGVMTFTITCQGGRSPQIDITGIKEPKRFGRLVRKYGLDVVESILEKLTEKAESEDGLSGSGLTETETVSDQPAAVQRFQRMNQKDWKVPFYALIADIAGRLDSMK